jgi:hypothetical protein
MTGVAALTWTNGRPAAIDGRHGQLRGRISGTFRPAGPSNRYCYRERL